MARRELDLECGAYKDLLHELQDVPLARSPIFVPHYFHDVYSHPFEPLYTPTFVKVSPRNLETSFSVLMHMTISFAYTVHKARQVFFVRATRS